MKKGALAGVSIVVVGCVSWMLHERRPASHLTEVEVQDDRSSQRVESQNRVDSASSLKPGSQAVVGSPFSLPGSNPSPDSQKPYSIDREVVSKLASFHLLDQKIFLSEKEESEKKSLLQNREYLAMASKLLSSVESMQDPQYQESQNTAIDILINALKQGDKTFAVEVISQLIRDPQVESTAFSKKVRETLAGIKGELLYHATAMSPRDFANIETSLPGPVSQRIWLNVQMKQQDNFSESQAEMQAHHAKWKK